MRVLIGVEGDVCAVIFVVTVILKDCKYMCVDLVFSIPDVRKEMIKERGGYEQGQLTLLHSGRAGVRGCWVSRRFLS